MVIKSVSILKRNGNIKTTNKSFFPWYIGNTDNVVVAYKAHLQNEICLSLAVFVSKVIYTLKYYFVARRLDLARVSFAVFNGYGRLWNAVYGRLTESSAKDVRGNWYNCSRKFWKRGILRSSLLNNYVCNAVMTVNKTYILLVTK